MYVEHIAAIVRRTPAEVPRQTALLLPQMGEHAEIVFNGECVWLAVQVWFALASPKIVSCWSTFCAGAQFVR